MSFERQRLSVVGRVSLLAQPWWRVSWLLPSALFVAALLLYLSTLTQVHTFDALSYVTSVEHKPWTEVFHPHHLAYGPLGAIALAAGRAVGFTGGAALPMQIVNAFAGALGVALFFTVIRRVTQRSDLALVAALLLGGAYAYWYYAVEIEVYTVATLFLVVCLDLLARIIARPTVKLCALLGLAQGGAVLFHQTNVLLCVPIVAVFVCARQPTIVNGPLPERLCWRGGRWSAMLKQGGVYGIVLALTVGLPYLFVAVVSDFRSIDDFSVWLTEYVRTGWWGGPITASNWTRLALGLAETLAQPSGALLGLLLGVLVVVHVRRLARAPRLLVAALLLWLLVYGAFFFWWEPDNIEFWIASLPPAAMLLALALAGERRWGPGVLVALGICVTLLVVNRDAIAMRGDARNDLQRVIARALGAQSQPGDLMLVSDELLELYLPYYQQRDNILSINQAMFANGEDWPHACEMIHTRIELALHAGATALLADETLHPPQLLLSRHHLARTQVDACFAPYRADLRAVPMPAHTFAYWRLPTGAERAQGAGWDFAAAPNGWQATNVRDQRFVRGWEFMPERDPALTSPLLNLQASRYRAIEIRLANSTRAHDAQLFFAGPDGSITEARSIRWTLKPTQHATTYTLDLRTASGWQNTVTRLRLDPVGIGDGGTLRVETVRLIP